MTTPTQITTKTRIRRAVDIPFAKAHDEMLAIDEQAGYYYAMNETSGRIWELIADPASVEAICTLLCQEFNVDADTCQREVIHLLHDLHDAGLVHIMDDKD